jgi:hypothetical protein
MPQMSASALSCPTALRRGARNSWLARRVYTGEPGGRGAFLPFSALPSSLTAAPPSCCTSPGAAFAEEVATWQMRRPQGPPYSSAEADATVYLLFSSTAPGSYRWPRPFASSRRGLRLVLAKDVPFGGCSGVGCRLSWHRWPVDNVPSRRVWPSHHPAASANLCTRRGLRFAPVLRPVSGRRDQERDLHLCVHKKP